MASTQDALVPGSYWTNNLVAGFGAAKTFSDCAYSRTLDLICCVVEGASAEKTAGGLTFSNMGTAHGRVCWSEGRSSPQFVSIGTVGASSFTTANSANGANFTSTTTSGIGGTSPADDWTDICYSLANDCYIGVGPLGIIRTTSGLVAWTLVSATPRHTVEWSQDLGIFVALGRGSSDVMISTDGTTWTTYTGAINPDSWRSMIWHPFSESFIAVGHPAVAGGKRSISQSFNGAQWFARETPITANWAHISFDAQADSIVVLATDVFSNNIPRGLISRNGRTWRSTATPWDSIPHAFSYVSSAFARGQQRYNAFGYDLPSSVPIVIVSEFEYDLGEIVYLFDIDFYNRSTNAVDTHYYGTASYNDEFGDGVGSEESNRFYEGRVVGPPDFSRYLIAPKSTSGSSRVTPGDIVLANNDGALDFIRDRGVSGQSIRIRMGYSLMQISTFITLAVGTIDKALPNYSTGTIAGEYVDTITLVIKDRSEDFSIPFQDSKYTGVFDSISGIDGGDNLKDKFLPVDFGYVYNQSPDLVNQSLLIYRASELDVYSIPNVYDNAEALTAAAEYTSLGDILANAPASGYFKAWPAGGLFRIGALPSGTITCDVIEGTSSDTSRTAAQIVYRMLTEKMDYVDDDISLDDIDELDALNRAPVGISITGSDTQQSVLDQVLGSIGANIGFDRLDTIRLRRLNLPLVENAAVVLRDPQDTVMDLGDIPISAITFAQTNDSDKGIPTYQVDIGFKKNYTVQSGDGLAGDVATTSLDRVEFVNLEYRHAVNAADWVRIANPNSPKKTINTLLVDFEDADEESRRNLKLYAGRRDFLEVDVKMTITALDKIDIGYTVVLVTNRYGYDDGLPMIITGIGYSTKKNTMTLELWGGPEDTIGLFAVGSNVALGQVGTTLTSWGTYGSVASPGVDQIISYGSVA